MKHAFFLFLILFFSAPSLYSMSTDRCSDKFFSFFRALNSFWANQEHEYDSPWFFQVAPSYTQNFQAFDTCGQCIPLASFLFGPKLIIADIYCPSRLAKEGILIGGCDADHNYLIELANTELLFCAEQTMIEYDITGWYSCCLMELDIAFGLTIPVRQRSRRLDFDVQGGALGRLVTTDSQFSPWANNLSEYFSEFSGGARDFLLSQIFKQCKDLQYTPCQNEIGVENVTLLSFASLSNLVPWDEEYHLQALAGLQITVPTGQECIDQTIIWPLGQRQNSTSWSPFVYIRGDLCSWLRPSLFIGGCISNSTSSSLRIPRIISGTPSNFSALCLPQNFNIALIEKDFECCDSPTPLLADTVVCADIDWGSSIIARVGGEFLFKALELGIYYIVDKRNAGYIQITDQNTSEKFDSSSVALTHDSAVYSLEWYVQARGCDEFIWQIGAIHALKGDNSLKTDRYFFSLAIGY